MDVITIYTILIASVVAIVGFLWTLHRDVSNLRKEVGQEIGDLRERMARMEGLLEGFVARPKEARP